MDEHLSLRELRRMLAAGLPRPRYAIAGVLPAVGTSLLYGPSGAGKTGLAVNVAVAVASAQQWAGREIEGGGVLYIAGEDVLGVRARLIAAADEVGCDDLPLVVAARPRAPLTRTAFVEAVEKIADERVDDLDILSLIVIDTLAACFGPDSQDDAGPASAAMNTLETLATSLNAAVLAIHHTGKAQSGMRGSQVFFDRADAVLRVRPHGQGGSVEIEKMRSGPGGGRFAFDIGARDLSDGDENFAVQVVRTVQPVEHSAEQPGCAPREAEKPVTDTEFMFQILMEIQAVAEVTGSVTMRAWREAVFGAWEHKTEGARKAAFSKGCKSLKARGKITVRNGKVTAKVTGNSTGNVGREVTSYRYTPPRNEGGIGNVGNAALPPASETVDVEPPKDSTDRKART